MAAKCGGCGKRWNSMGQAHCATCHEQFNSTAAFDRHREGPFADRSCIPVERFGEPYGKAAKPRLLRTSRADGDVWVTSLREAL